MTTGPDALEEFSAGRQYDEHLRKCWLCGRVITHEPRSHEVLGEHRTFCSDGCIEDYHRYRKPYVHDDRR